jgi:hypothetical protein
MLESIYTLKVGVKKPVAFKAPFTSVVLETQE